MKRESRAEDQWVNKYMYRNECIKDILVIFSTYEWQSQSQQNMWMYSKVKANRAANKQILQKLA